jgi:hypothetical protein
MHVKLMYTQRNISYDAGSTCSSAMADYVKSFSCCTCDSSFLLSCSSLIVTSFLRILYLLSCVNVIQYHELSYQCNRARIGLWYSSLINDGVPFIIDLFGFILNAANWWLFNTVGLTTPLYGPHTLSPLES